MDDTKFGVGVVYEMFTPKLEWLDGWENWKIITKEPKQMTRNEAEKLVCKLSYNVGSSKIFDGHGLPPEKQFVNVLEALGLLKFEEEKKEVICLSEINDAGGTSNNFHAEGANILRNYGPIRLELWSEGLVLWVGGEIKWKSWEKYYTKGDAAYFEYYNPEKADKQTQAGILK